MLEITAAKGSLRLSVPLMNAAGTLGFASEAARLLDLSLLGAFVTNPISHRPRRAAVGTRVVPLDSGVVVHTGLPNPGLSKAHRRYAAKWKMLPTALILHLIANQPDEISDSAAFLDNLDEVQAIELGIADLATHRDVKLIVSAARRACQKPLLVRLPLYQAVYLYAAAAESGADALVVAAPPRGSVRDPLSGQFVGGRLYGPWLKPLALRLVGQIAARVKLPVIGSGGVHHPDDVRDYLDAGAKAVQVDSALWIRPEILPRLVAPFRDTGLTQASGAFPEDSGFTLSIDPAERRGQVIASPPPPNRPNPPEV